MRSQDRWLEWVKELQALSQSALAYCRDVYDIERFQRIREISAEMMASLTDLPVDRVRAVFASETGYQTPKVDTRAAILQNGRILLAQERDGRWAIPGGWCDADLSVADNAVKEAFEETGARVKPLRLIALLDRNRHLSPPHVQEITTAMVLCEYVSGSFQPNAETVDSRFFTLEEALALPLSTGKTCPEYLELCFRAAADDAWQVVLD